MGTQQAVRRSRRAPKPAATATRLAGTVMSAVLFAALPAGNGANNAAAAVGPTATPEQHTSGAPEQPRIVGGTNARSAQYPWVVALTYRDGGAQFCGGSLVAPDRVLTAAHCLVDPGTGKPRDPSSVRAVAGRDDLNSSAGTTANGAGVWVEPQYHGYADGADVAVLTLAHPVGHGVIPIARRGDDRPYATGTHAQVLGWGRTSETAPPSTRLHAANVSILPDARCGNAYPDYDANAMVCAGAAHGGRDACEGDSGGPLIAEGRLVGVVSFGTGCGRADSPGVYTRLSTYEPEISGQLGERAS